MIRPGVIYLIRCSESEKVYVGSTILPPRIRMSQHFHCLRNGRHHSPHLQHAYDKYGDATFSFAIVEKVEDADFIRAREQFWMWRFEGLLFNALLDAWSSYGTKRTSESKAAQSARLMGNTIRRGTRMPAEAKAAIKASLVGNKRRVGIPHRPEDKKKIGDGLRRAAAAGLRDVATAALAAFRSQIESGERESPWVKQYRNDEMVRMYKSGMNFSAVALHFGLDASGCRKTILGHIKRMEGNKDAVGF